MADNYTMLEELGSMAIPPSTIPENHSLTYHVQAVALGLFTRRKTGRQVNMLPLNT
jgi:hypothetical protein